MTDRYLIVGLGNPGPEYKDTRHNIGFRCVDVLAARHGLSFDKRQSKATIAAGSIAGRSVLLAKPQTFMNLSGDSVAALAGFYKIPPAQIMVIFDDIDLPLGTLRIRPAGGSGGHNGMKSIIARLGTQEFARIRFGVSRPPGRMDPAAYVLRPFERDEEILVVETVERVCKAVIAWITAGIEQAMNQHNGTVEETARRRQAEAPASLPEDKPAH